MCNFDWQWLRSFVPQCVGVCSGDGRAERWWERRNKKRMWTRVGKKNKPEVPGEAAHTATWGQPMSDSARLPGCAMTDDNPTDMNSLWHCWVSDTMEEKHLEKKTKNVCPSWMPAKLLCPLLFILMTTVTSCSHMHYCVNAGVKCTAVVIYLYILDG